MAHCEQKTTHPCAVEGCRNPEAEAGLCWGHLKRRKRGRSLDGPLRQYGRTARENLVAAALRCADADDDDEYRRSSKTLRIYAQRYARQAGAKARRNNVPKATHTPG